MPRIGIIGGSGLYQIEGLEQVREIRVDTPFGDPSDVLTLGRLDGREVLFLPRHGRGHRILPAEVNNRANIWAMKSLDVAWIISVSAVGSLRPELKPLDLVLIDQFVDRTNQARPNTFFGSGIVAHIAFAHPLCTTVGEILTRAASGLGMSVQQGGTYVNIEGPAFSTLAESRLYRSWGMDVVGMTQMNEARLAREAEICYATLAMVTDFDCWWEAETGHTVSVELVVENLRQSSVAAREVIRHSIAAFPETAACSCQKALAGAIITERSAWPEETISRLEPLLQKYL
ncbi:MAG TPA: S-methyl-5'-thioadenosine phosphorylase [bacterium]|nr:S-methyl-5'-thioadenosine phosphorylase [bacterium]HQG45793.1 S-methyl-5'-thioadenosine phosphorylase [bacterium]HQI47691.1 S-methyl-5'-thioadenosine phosphorylase [bacterium]HQJ63463.1 S-methyl-5'-thioadenosine phosphorylase [bacterium]